MTHKENSMTDIMTTCPHEFIVPRSFTPYPGLIALQSTRKGGVSSEAYASLNLGKNSGDDPQLVYQNTLCLCAAAGIDPARMVSSTQVHGTEILCAQKPGEYHGYDAFITNRQDLFLSIFTADCIPILLFDPHNHAAGAVHAGWKGSAGKIVMKTIQAMQANFGSVPNECLAFIGTGISGAAYEVGPEVALAFNPAERQPSSQPDEAQKYLLDLSAVNFRQLIESGVSASNIERSPFCSLNDSDLFYSYRRDNSKTGRMVSLIGLSSTLVTG
jgi:YfiH family protein